MSSYDALAASYDGLMADGVYRRRADYLEKLFRKSRIPVHTVLDLACGTGTIACLLAAKGYAVTATDLSEEMLTQAMSKAADLEQPPLFVQQSMPRLRLPEPVDAVVSTLDSLNYLTLYTVMEAKAGKMELSLSQVWGGVGLAHDPLADRYIVEKIVRTQMALAGAKRSTRLQARTEELREILTALLRAREEWRHANRRTN